MTFHIRRVENFKVFNAAFESTRLHARSRTLFNLTMDGRTYFALSVPDRETLGSGPTVVAFAGPDEGRVLAWIDPESRELRWTQETPLLVAAPAAVLVMVLFRACDYFQWNERVCLVLLALPVVGAIGYYARNVLERGRIAKALRQLEGR